MALAGEGEQVQSSLKGRISKLPGPQRDYSVFSTLLSFHMKKSMARTIARHPTIIWLMKGTEVQTLGELHMRGTTN